jgi:hypothetical protein
MCVYKLYITQNMSDKKEPMFISHELTIQADQIIGVYTPETELMKPKKFVVITKQGQFPVKQDTMERAWKYLADGKFSVV